MCAAMQISIETKFVRHFSFYHKSHFKGHHILGGEVFSGQISSTLSYLLSLSLNCTVSRCFLSICSLSTLLAFSRQRTLSLSWFSLTLLASRDFLAARLFFLSNIIIIPDMFNSMFGVSQPSAATEPSSNYFPLII